MSQDGPRYPRILRRQSDRGDVYMAPVLKLFDPNAFGVGFGTQYANIGTRPMYQQSTKIPISHPCNFTEAGLAAAGVLSWRHPQSRREASAAMVDACITNAGNQCRRRL